MDRIAVSLRLPAAPPADEVTSVLVVVVTIVMLPPEGGVGALEAPPDGPVLDGATEKEVLVLLGREAPAAAGVTGSATAAWPRA
jgi:hypothetical protein